jgi:hypothetical protein
MLAMLFLVEDVGMAALASLMAGEVDGPRGDFGYRISAVVPVFSEAFGNQGTAEDQEQEEARDKNCGQTEKVSGISEDLHGGARDRSFAPETRPTAFRLDATLNWIQGNMHRPLCSVSRFGCANDHRYK